MAFVFLLKMTLQTQDWIQSGGYQSSFQGFTFTLSTSKFHTTAAVDFIHHKNLQGKKKRKDSITMEEVPKLERSHIKCLSVG